MIVRRGLLRIMWRQALPATLLGGLGLSAYVLFYPSVITIHDFGPLLLVFLQSLLLAASLGRFASPAFAFIHSRGYSRDSLWGHVVLTSGLSLVAAWLPAALIMWTGLRSAMCDHLFQSPYFPIMAPREMAVPLSWLIVYSLLILVFHYTWIRNAQPTKGPRNGIIVAVAVVVTTFLAFDMTVGNSSDWLPWLLGALYAAAASGLIFGSRALYRSLEVRA